MVYVCLMLQEYLASRAWQRVPAALAVETAASADPLPKLPYLTRASRAQCIMFPGIDIHRRTKGPCLQSRNHAMKRG